MRRYRFYQADVFTREPFAGNAVAVLPDAEGLTADVMQKIARELNLSETSFVTPSTVATRHVRFFTPVSEIPFAGHPTLGTWFVLAASGRVPLSGEGSTIFTQEVGAGVLPVEVLSRGDEVERVVMTQGPPVFGPVLEDLVTLERVLGLPPGQIAAQPTAPQIVSTGLPQLMVPVGSLATLSGARVHSGMLAEFLRPYQTDCAMCFSLEAVDDSSDAHCRMFAPGLGVPEDPGTGSAAGALGAYLVKHGIVPGTPGRRVSLTFEQGLELGRPSRIEVELTMDGGGEPCVVRVGGSCVLVLEGEVRV